MDPVEQHIRYKKRKKDTIKNKKIYKKLTIKQFQTFFFLYIKKVAKVDDF